MTLISLHYYYYYFRATTIFLKASSAISHVGLFPHVQWFSEAPQKGLHWTDTFRKAMQVCNLDC